MNRKRGNLISLNNGNDLIVHVQASTRMRKYSKYNSKNDIQVYTTTRIGLCFVIVLTLQPSCQVRNFMLTQ